MLARLQQFITVGLVAMAALWAAVFIRAGALAWAAGGVLLILFGYALFLAFEFGLMHRINRHDAAPRATLRQVIVAWWGEVLTAPRVFCWRQPFRSNAVPDFLPAGSRRRGVLFVHGFVCNRGLWNPFMLRLQALGVPVVAVNLEPVFGSIDRYVETIDAAVDRITAATGQAPVIVAHSMGGLATRAWLDANEADARVHRVVTIGSPHHGTFLGYFGQTPNTRQMRPDSAWRRQLEAREPPQRFERFTCFFGHCDNIVFPASTATLPAADNRHVAGCAHVHMAHHEAVFSQVVRWQAA